ncbi:MAG: ATP-binding protein [Bacteroidota bacterium]
MPIDANSEPSAGAVEVGTLSGGRVNIRPGVNVLAILQHVSYAPWYALAEYVDNALQSFLSERERLAEVGTGVLQVNIDLDTSDQPRLTIRDNAAGIAEADYPRAFRPAEVPPDRSGLSEFGMGMKSASCWFSPQWTVRTSALGETTEKTVVFNIGQIVRDSIEELNVSAEPAPADRHFTEITLLDLHRVPRGRTVGKIKEHLADIYREYTRSGDLSLRFNGELLTYEEPDILIAPFYKTQDEEPVTWRKKIDIDLGDDLYARGFAALRETGSTSKAGFALFRRKRVIQGSGDEGYRPPFIFGRSNSYTFQRLFGELYLEGFGVSHTKDGFQWQESEQAFLELLKEQLNEDPVPLLSQAEGFRKRPRPEDVKKGAEEAAERTASVIERDVAPVIERISEDTARVSPSETLSPAQLVTRQVRTVRFKDQTWQVVLELSHDPAVGDWVEVSDGVLEGTETEKGIRQVGVRMSLVHPFMERFGGSEAQDIEPLLRMAVAIALAETAAYDSAVEHASTIRRNVNELLRYALSRPK